MKLFLILLFATFSVQAFPVKDLGNGYELHIGKHPLFIYDGTFRAALWNIVGDSRTIVWTYNDTTDNGVHDGYVWLDVQGQIPHGVMALFIIRAANTYLRQFIADPNGPPLGQFNPYTTDVINDIQAIEVDENGLFIEF